MKACNTLSETLSTDIFKYKSDISTMNRQEKFENTKGVIRSRKWTRDRQHNNQKKKDKDTNNDLQNNTQKLYFGEH